MKGEELLRLVRKFSGESQWSRYDEINDAHEIICRRAGFNFLRVRDEDVFQFETESIQILPDGIRRLEDIWIKNTTDFQDWIQVILVDDKRFEQEVYTWRNSDGTNITGYPRFCRISGKKIEVTPTPNAVYPARLIYIAETTPIDRTSEPVIPNDYHRIIAKLAAVKVLSQPKDRLTEGQMVERQKTVAMLTSDINEAELPMAFDTTLAVNTGLSTPIRRMMRV